MSATNIRIVVPRCVFQNHYLTNDIFVAVKERFPDRFVVITTTDPPTNPTGGTHE